MVSINILLSILLILLIFIISKFIPTLKLENYQTIDLCVTSIFLLIIIGGLGKTFNNDNNYLNNIGLITILFIFWYYLTLRFSNLLSSDNNSVIRY